MDTEEGVIDLAYRPAYDNLYIFVYQFIVEEVFGVGAEFIDCKFGTVKLFYICGYEDVIGMVDYKYPTLFLGLLLNVYLTELSLTLLLILSPL